MNGEQPDPITLEVKIPEPMTRATATYTYPPQLPERFRVQRDAANGVEKGVGACFQDGVCVIRWEGGEYQQVVYRDGQVVNRPFSFARWAHDDLMPREMSREPRKIEDE